MPAPVLAGSIRCAAGEDTAALSALPLHFTTLRDALIRIMHSFPLVRRRDEAVHGRYRTLERILACCDASR